LRRRTKVLLVLVALFVLAAAGMVLAAVRHGFSTHDDPTAVESFVARSLRNLAVPADLRGATNALPGTPENVAEGRAHWADHCASCHGNDGKGQTTLGQHLYPRAPDMTLPATQELSDGQLFAFIENGIRRTGMPGWGDGTAESAHGSWALVHFIRHLPELTAEELAEMEALNPKSPAEWQALQEEAAFLGGGDPPPAEEADGDHR
jgi:mono/diheme cytochrome c family protein